MDVYRIDVKIGLERGSDFFEVLWLVIGCECLCFLVWGGKVGVLCGFRGLVCYFLVFF